MTGGEFKIESRSADEFSDHGTKVYAKFIKDSIDCIPLGDIIGTVCTLIQGHDGVDFTFVHKINGKAVELSTAEMRQMLGDVPLSSPDVISWIKEYLGEAYAEIQ